MAIPQDPRLHVVFLNPSATVGGAERVLLDLLAEMPAGFRATVVAGEDGPLLAEARGLGAAALALPFPRRFERLGDSGAPGRSRLSGQLAAAAPGVASYLLALRRRLARVAPDLIHSNGFKMHLLAAAATPRGVPVVWHLHDYLSRRPLAAHLLVRLAGRAAATVANSPSVAADARAVLGRARRWPRVTVAANGVDLDRFRPPDADAAVEAARRLDERAGLPPAAPGTVRVGLVATFGRWKGHDVFLRALARLDGNPPVRGFIVGGPIYHTAGSQVSQAELHRLVDALGLAGRVGFCGHLAEPAAAFAGLDVAVHASVEPEPFGLAIAEAMACARAVVAAGAGGAADLVTPETDGLLHTPGDDAGLAAAIARLAADPDLRRRIGAAARATAEARFDRRRTAAEVAALWTRVRAEAGRGARPAPRPDPAPERGAGR